MAGVIVQCYAGGRADEEPRRVVEGGRTREVTGILDRALTPDERRFLVALSDGTRCRLVQMRADGRWRLERA